MTIATRATKTVPSPPTRGFWGNLSQFQTEPFRFLSDVSSQYGDIVKFRMGPIDFYFLNHPDYIKHILITNRKNYHRDRKFLAEATPFLGQGLLTTDDEVWARLRRIAQPVFHANQMANYAAMISEATAAYIKRWQVAANTNQVLNLKDEMLHLTLGIVAPTLFGANVTDEWQTFIHTVDVLQAEVARRLITPITLPLWVPTSGNLQTRQALQTLDRMVFAMIAAYRQQQKQEMNLMNALIQARDQATGDSLSDREIRDQILTLLVAGYETTASALSWLFYLLSQHPQVEEKLRCEVESMLGNEPPTYQDIPRMKYTRMVIQESLRLYPPIWIFARSPLQADRLGDYEIPANTVVYISPLIMHRHPEFWSNPHEFKPERFDPALESTHSELAYIPFGTGARSCIGRNFAMMMMQLIVPKILQEYRFHLIPDFQVKHQFDITLHPQDGIYMQVENVG
jgi:cytochrome P450